MSCEDCASMRRQIAIAIAEADAAKADAERANGVMAAKVETVDRLHEVIAKLKEELADASPDRRNR